MDAPPLENPPAGIEGSLQIAPVLNPPAARLKIAA
jgi:hypothetical protein